ncbi:MAG: hypothetical protein H0T79_10460 [Deltaproteobacteria bacterium]|nr:hypothetical protein [Deltaproteobacteria bacterium]
MLYSGGSGGLGGFANDRPTGAFLIRSESDQKLPVTRAPRSRRWLWVLLLVMALIAALVWWLVL